MWQFFVRVNYIVDARTWRKPSFLVLEIAAYMKVVQKLGFNLQIRCNSHLYTVVTVMRHDTVA